MCHVWVHVGHWVLLVAILELALGDMRLKTLVEVHCANNSVDDGDNDKHNRDDSYSVLEQTMCTTRMNLPNDVSERRAGL